MSETFIQRRFDLGNSAGVYIRFDRPAPDGDDFRCNYEVVWPDRRRAFYAVGVDELQALFLAIQMAHADLVSSPEGKRGELSWLGSRDLGLPLPGSRAS
jgi:Domain of unknown function (DUF6968)